MLQSLSEILSDLVYSLFGPGAQRVYEEYPVIFWLILAGAAAIPAGLALLVVMRAARGVFGTVSRTRRDFGRDFHLRLSGRGRQFLKLAGEMQRGCARVRRMVGTGGGDAGENEALLRLLTRFLSENLPEVLAQAHTFIAAGGGRREARLEAVLAKQQARWGELADGQDRQELQEEIAATRQGLAQVRHAEESLATLLKGLQEAALALGTLEMEMATLGATRSAALGELRDHLSDMAEGLHHQGQAHLSFRNNS